MKKIAKASLAAGLGLFMLSGAASAATLNFTQYIDTVAGEHSVVGDFSLGGFTVSTHGSTTLTGSVDAGFANYGSDPQAYFDAGSAGIGVCRQTVNTQCNPTNDDNVTGPDTPTPGSPIEVLSMAFNAAVSVTNLIFKAEGHNFSFTRGDVIDLSTDGTTWQTYAFVNGTGALLGNPVFLLAAGQYLHMKFNNEQFYLSAATVTGVPVPAAALFLLSGLAGLGFLGRYKKGAATA